MRAGTLPGFPATAQAISPAALVSIVVVNHNYGRFLACAVDSALAQHGATVEVIVVDDGSTDGSRALLKTYGERIGTVLQPNGGQAAALNAGLEAARGDVVLFLDADDALEPSVAARALAAFAASPGVSRVVFRLAIVDEAGQPTGELMPARDVPLAGGDVRARVLAYGDDLAWPPTSGNAFAAWALRRVMPLPITEDRVDADAWLHPTVPLLGPVVALDGIGGAYRAHGTNHAFRHGADPQRSRRIIATTARAHGHLAQVAAGLGYGRPPARSVTIAAHRMVSLRLGGPGHPVPGDTRARALTDGVGAALRRDDVSLVRCLAYVGWFTAAFLAPRRWVRPLADAFFVPSRRAPRLRRLLHR